MAKENSDKKYSKGMHPNSQKGLIKFKKGQSGNPHGRPPTLTNALINELYSLGYEKVQASQIKEAYLTMLNLPINKIHEIVNDDQSPAMLRIVGRQLLSPKGFEAIETLLQRALGQPKQEHEITQHSREMPIVRASDYFAWKNGNQ